MFCIDWNDDDPYSIQGYEFDNDYTRIEVRLLPCNYIHTMLGHEGDFVNPDCVTDLES